MNKDEVVEAMDHVRQFWPNWDTPDAVEAVWSRALRDFSSLQRVLAGVERYYSQRTTFDRREPQLATLLQHIRAEGADADDQQAGLYEPGLFLFCSAAPPAHPSRAGRIVPMIWSTCPGDEAACKAIAHREREAHEAIYGGSWVVLDLRGIRPEKWPEELRQARSRIPDARPPEVLTVNARAGLAPPSRSARNRSARRLQEVAS